MKAIKKTISQKVGLPPGSIVYVGETNPVKTSINLITYDEQYFSSLSLNNFKDLKSKIDENKNNWILISGYENIELIKEIGENYNIHPLLMEDALKTLHLPKYESEDDEVSFILKEIGIDNGNTVLIYHRFLFLDKNILILLQDIETNTLSKLIERLSEGKGKARYKGLDYLMFLIFDSYLDTYYSFFENIRDEITELEESILTESNENYLNEIYSLKKKLTIIRKNLYPLKDSILKLFRDEETQIKEENKIYFNDLNNHVEELIEYYRSFEESIGTLFYLNENNITHNTNEVTKILTIIATIFIPLTFIAGIYGMNFRFMPELEWKYGYFAVLIVMFFIGIFFFIFVKKKNWF